VKLYAVKIIIKNTEILISFNSFLKKVKIKNALNTPIVICAAIVKSRVPGITNPVAIRKIG
jgi:hypothetical protein